MPLIFFIDLTKYYIPGVDKPRRGCERGTQRALSAALRGSERLARGRGRIA